MDSQKKIKVGIAVVISVIVIAMFFGGYKYMSNQNTPAADTSTTGSQSDSLVVQDEVVGTGAEAKTGDTLTMNYTGKLENGTVFDSTTGKTPFQFVLGDSRLIKGWTMGVAGMKEGGKRLLIIPSDLGYGSTAYGPIPANSKLIFEIELVKVASSSASGAEGAAAN